MENVERGATQVVSGEGKTLWVLGALYEFEATSEDTGGKFALWETTTPPGNPGPPPHIHHNEDEVFYLLEGELELMVEGRTSVVGAGTFVNIPKVTLHTFRNAGTTPARFLGMVAPGGFEGFFEEVGEPASDGSSLTCGTAGRREDHGDRPQVRPRDTAASWRVSSFGDGKTVALSTPGHQTVTHGVGAFWHPPRPLLSAVAWIIVP